MRWLVYTLSREIFHTQTVVNASTRQRNILTTHIGGLKKYIFLPQQIICPLPRQIRLADDGNECANKLILTIV